MKGEALLYSSNATLVWNFMPALGLFHLTTPHVLRAWSFILAWASCRLHVTIPQLVGFQLL